MIEEARQKSMNANILNEQEKAQKELEAAKDPLSKQNLEAEVEAVFAKLDVENKGFLTPDQAKKFIDDWMKENAKDKEEVEEVKFEDLDLDGNGELDKEELKQFLFD